jgi:hypothetical protein
MQFGITAASVLRRTGVNVGAVLAVLIVVWTMAVQPASAAQDARITAAINWALNHQNASASQWYDQNCLAFVNDAYVYGANTPMLVQGLKTAQQAANYFNAASRTGLPPRGAWAFYTNGTLGHVGLSLGDGRVISSLGLKYGGIKITQYNFMPYIGWAYPSANPPLGDTISLPAQPVNPGCTSGTATSLNMIWGDASNNEDDFVVQFRIGSGGWVFAGKVANAGGTGGTVSGLAPATTYTFQVGARNAAGTHWSVYFYGVTKPAPVTRPTVLIDDPAAGFYGPPYWNIGYVGYGGSVHWTRNAVSAVENYATWRPNLAGGNYEVQVHIPSNYANTRNAVYQIYTGYGWASRSVNQEPYSNVWISIGIYNFTAGTSAYVQLNDATGEPYLSRMIGFDAVQFIPR